MVAASCTPDATNDQDTSEIAVAPPLGTLQSFAILGAATVTNTGPTVVTGDLGVSPGSAITGFPPGVVIGTIHANDAVALQAQNAATTAYNNLAGQACDTTFGVPTDLVGLTLVPGVYCFSSSAGLTGQLTLDAQGDPNAVWVFKVGSTLITGSNASVLLVNGGQPCNVFWQVGSSATIGTGTTFVGTIIALASVTLTTNVQLSGRAVARTGAVTMDTNDVAITACAIPPDGPLPPTVGKAFSPATIPAGGVSTLTLTLLNLDDTVAVLTSPFSDILPAGVTILGAPTTTCGGLVSSTLSSVTLTGGAIPANGSCTITAFVTAASGGVYVNDVPIGALVTTNGSNAAPAVATLTVPVAPTAPTVAKAFSPATIATGGQSTLTITLNNSSAAIAILTAPLVDTLPTGLVIAPVPNATTTCGGLVTAPAGGGSVTLTGGIIPASGSCTVSVAVTAAASGAYVNTIAAGALQTTNGSNAAPAVSTVTVVAPGQVAIAKEFTPATIAPGGASTLTITLTNANASIATLTAPLVDTLPPGVTVTAAPTSTCGGMLSATTSSVTLTGGAIPANGSCTITVPVTAPNGGSFINEILAGALQTSNGNNQGPTLATLTVTSPSPIALGKAFGSTAIPAGGTTSLVITLSNTGAIAAALTAPLVDELPVGLFVAGVPITTCGGVVSAPIGGTTVTQTGGSIPANGTCTVSVLVTAPVAGSYFNTLLAGALQTDQGSNAGPAVATLVVTPLVGVAPTLAKRFSPSTIDASSVSTLTITLTNPNEVIATLTAPLVDTLPNGVVVVGNAGTTCGGIVTAVPGSSTVTLLGGAIPASGSCEVFVDVTSHHKGTYTNTLPIGALQTDQGSNATQAIAILRVREKQDKPSKPWLEKKFSPHAISLGGSSRLTITLHNENSTAATLTAPLVDNFPYGLVVDGMPTTTCGGAVSATSGGRKVKLAGGSIPAHGSCKVTVDVTSYHAGSYHNEIAAGALQTNRGKNAFPASATLVVGKAK